MHADDRDFFGHPPARRFPYGLIAALLFALLLVAAMAWSQSFYGDDFFAMKEAERQCELLGMKNGCEVVARPRKKKECSFVAALSPQVQNAPLSSSKTRTN